MRHLLAILALFITGTLACQVVGHTLPQNEDGGQASSCTPLDSNGDNLVGVSDLMDLLARFGDSDLDEDGIWDSEDDCVGVLDECGVCNGPGPNAIGSIPSSSLMILSTSHKLTFGMSLRWMQIRSSQSRAAVMKRIVMTLVPAIGRNMRGVITAVSAVWIQVRRITILGRLLHRIVCSVNQERLLFR